MKKHVDRLHANEADLEPAGSHGGMSPYPTCENGNDFDLNEFREFLSKGEDRAASSGALNLLGDWMRPAKWLKKRQTNLWTIMRMSQRNPE